MDELDQDQDDYQGPSYRRPESIGSTEIRAALKGLQLFGDDPNLSAQAFNLELIDQFLMKLEYELLKKQFEEESTPVPEAAFLSALSQMWIFAAYELIRTWRQRAKDIIKWSECGGLQSRLDHLQEDVGFQHVGRVWRAEQIKRVLANPSLVTRILDDVRRTHIPFIRMEAIRVSIAKHEVRGQKNSVALMPTYGRINRWCGSLDFELENGVSSMGTISRRDIADNIRSIAEATELPTDEEIHDFEACMRGPPADLGWE
jgi:hypothetical protein